MKLTIQFVLKRINEQNEYISQILSSDRPDHRKIELCNQAREILAYFENLLAIAKPVVVIKDPELSKEEFAERWKEFIESNPPMQVIHSYDPEPDYLQPEIAERDPGEGH